MLNSISTAYETMKTAFSHTQEGINAFNRSHILNVLHDYTHAMEQGASPNGFMVRLGELNSLSSTGSNIASFLSRVAWTKTSWLVTPFFMFLPALIHLWPRSDKDNQNYRWLVDGSLAVANRMRESDSMIERTLGTLILGFHHVVARLPEIRNRPIQRLLNFIERHILSMCMILTIAVYVGLFFSGFSVIAAIGATTLGLGILDRNNLLPIFMRNFIKKWGYHISILGGLLGNPIEILFSCIMIPIVYGHYFKGAITWALNRFEITRYFGEGLQAQEVRINQFDFQTPANQLEESLQSMNQMCEPVFAPASTLAPGAQLAPNTVYFDATPSVDCPQLYSNVSYRVRDPRHSHREIAGTIQGNFLINHRITPEFLQEYHRVLRQQLVENGHCQMAQVIRAHVLDNAGLVPPQRADVNINDLSTLFNAIDWNAEQAHVLEVFRRNDWRFNQENNQNNEPVLNEQAQYQRNINDLRNQLATVIRRVLTSDLHSVRTGADDLARRYAQGVTRILNDLSRRANDTSLSEAQRRVHRVTIIDTLMRLGYEGGNYCGIGVLRTFEGCYRSLVAENERGFSLRDRVRFIHQMHRELFFQNIYLSRRFNLADDAQDTHAYARAVGLLASRLGLPADFAEYDEVNAELYSPLARDFLALNPIMNEFWETTTVDVLKSQIRQALNTHLIPIAEVDRWYHSFIDRHVNGTDDEKDALKEQGAYDTEYHGEVPVYRFKEAALNAMLLDFDVISLPDQENTAQNTFRPPVSSSTPEQTRHNVLQFSKKDNNSIDNVPLRAAKGFSKGISIRRNKMRKPVYS